LVLLWARGLQSPGDVGQPSIEHSCKTALSCAVQTAASRTSLRALLGDHPATYALRHGALPSDAVALDFADVPVPNQAFRRVVRDLEFDVAELALMTFLIARSRGVPLRLLPVVVFSRNPLPHLICDAGRRVAPADLAGRRIGVRAYTTTTAVWIREILHHRFGVRPDAVEWITLEEGHVAGVNDPPHVRRVPAQGDLVTMLSAGDADAVIVDRVPQDGRVVTVTPDPDAAHRQWQDAHRALTLNHVIVVRESLARDERLMGEVFRLFRDSRAAADGLDPLTVPIGFEANRRNLEVAIDVARAQNLLANSLTAGDLVTGVLAALR
jgi:4,5-dihydroxyphthalate decarboxylase